MADVIKIIQTTTPAVKIEAGKGEKGDAGKIQDVLAGSNITINKANPNKPIISATIPPSDSASWGNISGTLADQTDLKAVTDSKADQTSLDAHTANTSNPHSVTKSQVGLGSVDNTADLAKPISTATQTALNGKASQTDMEAAQGEIEGLLGDVESLDTDFDTHTANTSNPHSVTKAQVGLGNADNTSDANKPVSTATQTELDKKLNKSLNSNSLYGVDSGNTQTMYSVYETAQVASVAKRDSGGRLAVATPTADGHAATKKYVDDGLASKADESGLATVATTGDYDDLTGKPTLGTAAAEDTGSFATAAQGALADTATQPEDLAAVATSGSYNDLADTPTVPTDFDDLSDGATNKAFTATEKSKLSGVAAGAEVNVQSDWSQASSSADDFIKNKPTLGTAAAAATTDFATAAQGATADTAVQPDDLAAVATSGSYDDLTDKPTIPELPDQFVESVTAGTNVSVNDTDPSNPIISSTDTTYSEIPEAEITTGTASTLRTITARRLKFATDAVKSYVDGLIGALATVASSGSYDDLSDTPTLGTAAAADTDDFATSAQGTLADTAIQAADLGAVATSNDYDDLDNKPSIPNDFDDLSDGTTNKAFTATLKNKLDGIEAAADVTDAANVASAGAVMTSGNQSIAGIKVFSGEVSRDGAAGTNRGFSFYTGGLPRWTFLAGNGAESGGDAGSEFAINSFDDAGDYKDTPFVISRVTGNSNFTGHRITEVADPTNDQDAATKKYVDDEIAAIDTGGAVDSVNSQTGVVVLDADDIDDTSTTNKFTSAAEISKLSGIEAGADVTDAANVGSAGAFMKATDDLDDITDGTTYKKYSQTEKTKLAGIASGATANDTDSNLKNRANHTGTQSADTITDGTTNHVFTASDDTKLAGIESGADVTDATNVAAAGAVMDSGSQTIAGVKTFSSFPVTPSSAPTGSYQVANRKYVDDELATKLDATFASGVGKLSVGTSTPSSPSTGDLWVDTN